MSDSPQTTGSTSASPEVGGPPTSHRRVSVGRIAAIVVPVAVVAAVVVLGAALGWHEPLMAAFKPPLVPGKGKVTFNGQPLETGFVNTLPSNSLSEPALGPLGPGGEFEFATNGTPGIAVGEHRVLVFSMGEGAIPQSNIPSLYNSPVTTPFVIDVSKDAAANTFVFELKGEAPGGGGGRGGAAGGTRGGQGRAGGRGGPRGGGPGGPASSGDPSAREQAGEGGAPISEAEPGPSGAEPSE